MKRFLASIAVAGALIAAPLPAFADEPLTYAQLKEMVEGLGYVATQKDATEMFEVAVSSGGFNIPVAFEVSKSGRYIWARASLGKVDLTGEDGLALLGKIRDIQPTHFWVTANGTLSIGMAVDNRDVTPVHMRYVLDKVATDTANTAPLWNKPKPAAPAQ